MGHVDIWQKPSRHYKAIILQLRINLSLKKLNNDEQKSL